MKIIPLSEGQFTVDASKNFIPYDPAKDQLNQRTRGSLLVEIQPFVVATSGEIIICDTGLGFQSGDMLQLHRNLANAGINSTEITKVLLTHLHKDHAGGISSSGVLSFPNAKYYIQEKELETAMQKGPPSYDMAKLKILLDNEQVVLLNGEGQINDSITYKHTGAHSPWHQVFWIKENGETIFFGGDEAPQIQQMRHRFIAKYDFDGRKAMHLRHEWFKQGEEEGWQFLFYHDIKNPSHRFSKLHF
jgi:glyoxylase-like metal-dependent hydrolase (beta-lactamase superfamily II)